MLVDVVPLRSLGEKRPKAEVLQATPTRAELRVMHMPGAKIAQLSFPWRGPASPGDNVPSLQDCRLQSIQGDSFVLIGAEFVGMYHERRRVPQAWWCRIVHAGAAPGATA